MALDSLEPPLWLIYQPPDSLEVFIFISHRLLRPPHHPFSEELLRAQLRSKRPRAISVLSHVRIVLFSITLELLATRAVRDFRTTAPHLL